MCVCCFTVCVTVWLLYILLVYTICILPWIQALLHDSDVDIISISLNYYHSTAAAFLWK